MGCRKDAALAQHVDFVLNDLSLHVQRLLGKAVLVDGEIHAKSCARDADFTSDIEAAIHAVATARRLLSAEEVLERLAETGDFFCSVTKPHADDSCPFGKEATEIPMEYSLIDESEFDFA